MESNISVLGVIERMSVTGDGVLNASVFCLFLWMAAVLTHTFGTYPCHRASGWSQSHPCVCSLWSLAHSAPGLAPSEDEWAYIIPATDLQNSPLQKHSLSHFTQESFTGIVLSYCLALFPGVLYSNHSGHVSVLWMFLVCSLGLCFRTFLTFGLITPSALVRTLWWNRILTDVTEAYDWANMKVKGRKSHSLPSESESENPWIREACLSKCRRRRNGLAKMLRQSRAHSPHPPLWPV